MRRGSESSSVMSTSPPTEQAVLEENENETPMTSPTSPFARRVSFGAHMLRDRVGSGSGNGRYPLFQDTFDGEISAAVINKQHVLYKQ